MHIVADFGDYYRLDWMENQDQLGLQFADHGASCYKQSDCCVTGQTDLCAGCSMGHCQSAEHSNGGRSLVAVLTDWDSSTV